MKRYFMNILQFCYYYYFSLMMVSLVFAQTFDDHQISKTNHSNQFIKPQYVAHPSHREIILKSFELAIAAGFSDTSEITVQEIKDRLETGAYSEDFESIPGAIGSHFPSPWNQGPDFDFLGLYPFSKIPYGSYTNTSSGWYRGLNHGYDPVQGYKWPNASATTLEWANHSANSFATL